MFFDAVDEIGRHPLEAGRGPKVFPNTRNLMVTPADRMWARWDGGRLGTSGVELWKVRSTGHAIDLEIASRVSYHVPVNGTLGLAFGDDELLARPGEGALLGTRRRRTHVIAPSGGIFEAMVVLLPEDRLAAMDMDGVPGLGQRGRVAREADRRLRAATTFLFEELSRPASPLLLSRALMGAGAFLADLYFDALTALAGGADPPLALPSAVQVHRAEAIMRERFAMPLSLADVARETGVGLRALQLAFRRHRGLTPHEALSLMRLEAARGRLLAAGPGDTVTTVALDCGFMHFGRFSLAYRRMYGEPPSATLGRARR